MSEQTQTETPAPSVVASELVDTWRTTGSTAALLSTLWDAVERVPAEQRTSHLAAVAMSAVIGQGEAIALAERLLAGGSR